MITKNTIKIGGKSYDIIESNLARFCKGPDYNFNFSKSDGAFMRWGATHKDDPDFSPIGPELLDVEITTSCNGINGVPCSWCYKSNTPKGSYMSFANFKRLFDQLPPTVCQIAFGVDSECKSNPDCWDIFNYARSKGVIPNVTVAQVDDETIHKLARVMGAVAVSRYDDKNICYDIVEKLGTEAFRGSFHGDLDEDDKAITLRQVNIHILLAEETYPNVMETLADIDKDKRLDFWLNAVVLLSLKQKGRGANLTPISDAKFRDLVKYVTSEKLRIGFDSCTCNKFLECVKDDAHYGQYKMLAEPCESGCFSLYANVDGRAFPCSFTEGTEGWVEGLDMFNVKNFSKDIWYHPSVKAWRKRLLACKRSCPIYKV